MDLEAIVLDIDGTLVNDKKMLTKRTKEKLLEAQKMGIKIVLASGRPTRGMMHLAKELELDRFGGYVASYNGGQIYDVQKDKVVFNQAIPIELANDILDYLSDWDVVPMIDIKDYLFVNNAYFDIQFAIPNGHQNVVEYEARVGDFKVCEVDNFREVIKQPLNKILVGGNPAYLEKHFDEMCKPFENETHTAFSAPFYFEYTDSGINKGRALDEIFSEIGISSKNIMAFGDSQNDRTLIEFAGMGVAMGNAVPEITEVANATTVSNNEDGIAVFLDQYL